MPRQARALDVISAGDLFVDLIMSGFPSWPVPGTEAFATDFHREIGGGAAITACGMARLGSRSALLGVVGADTGEWVANQLNSCGVVTSELRFDPAEPTAFSVAISTPEDRTFLTFPGSNRRFSATLAEAAADGRLARARHVHLAWAPDLENAPSLFEATRRNGCSISLDVGWHEKWLADARAMALMPLIDIFFPNETEARKMTGELEPEKILRKFEAAGAKRVALKLGPDGAALLWDGEILRTGPTPVRPLDTIGAGDSFNAGFLHSWLRGESPVTCLRAANFCGASSTEAYGGIDGFPDAERVERELKMNSNE
ncbi:MAG: PfkB domain protein [Bryobacterales bacterium]|nr:PfkB domain protein [Bryobacterales bacterium]